MSAEDHLRKKRIEIKHTFEVTALNDGENKTLKRLGTGSKLV